MQVATTSRSSPWTRFPARREVTAHPVVLDEERFSLDDLFLAARNSEVLYRGWPFISFEEGETRPRGKRIETTFDLTQLRGHEYFETWQLWQSGLFFHRALMEEDAASRAPERGKILDFEETIYHISEAIGSLWRLYSTLGIDDSDPISIEFRYTDARERRVDTVNPRRSIRTSLSCADEEVVRAREEPLGIWRSSDTDIASDIAAEVFQRFGWVSPNRPEITKIVRRFLAKPEYD